MKILFIDSTHPFLIEALRERGDECVECSNATLEEIEQHLSSAEGIIIRSRFYLGKDFLDKCLSLRFIARAGAGMESIDVGYAESKNIVCLNSPEGNRNAVGEHAAGMLLSLLNKINRADRQIRNGEWIREANRGTELRSKTVAIIGYGNTGTAFAKCLSGFGCRILAYDKYKTGFEDDNVKESSLEEVFVESDIVSLHVPLTVDTKFFVNDFFFNSFKKNIILINTARGQCVRTADLVKNLERGKVSGACLDVNEYEDLSFEKFKPANENLASNPDWQYLLSSDRVVLTPHIAGWTVESLEKIARVLYEKIIIHFPQAGS